MKKKNNTWQDLKSKKGRKRQRRRFLNVFRKIWGGYKSGGILGLYHYIRCNVWNRYHTIDISGEDGYKWGYIDSDYTLLLVSFKILRDYVEVEDPFVGLKSPVDYYDNADDPIRDMCEAQLVTEREVRALYTWWTIDRPREYEECDALLGGKNSKKWYETSNALYDKDNEMLCRLIKVRRSLWT